MDPCEKKIFNWEQTNSSDILQKNKLFVLNCVLKCFTVKGT